MLEVQHEELSTANVAPLFEGDVNDGYVDAFFDRWFEKVVAILKGLERCDNDGVEECGIVSSSEDEFVCEREIDRGIQFAPRF